MAIVLARSRQADAGTAGGITGLVKTPASNNPRQNLRVVSSGPISTGTIGVLAWLVSGDPVMIV